MQRESGSLHIIIMLGMIIVLIGVVGYMAWQNFGPNARHSAPLTSTASSSSTPTTSPAIQEPADLTRNSSPSKANIWAGYVADSDTFTSVEGRVKVPTVTCSGNQQAFAAWVGFDGWNGLPMVEQAGITATCEDASAYVKNAPINGVYYYAWSALHSAGKYDDINFIIKPGDTIYSKVTYGDGKYNMTVTNETTGQTQTDAQTCQLDQATKQQTGMTTCPRAYADWIVERPGSNQMANFGQTTLYDNVAVTQSGKKAYIESFHNTFLDMYQSSQQLAYTTDLLGKGAFKVHWTATGTAGD